MFIPIFYIKFSLVDKQVNYLLKFQNLDYTHIKMVVNVERKYYIGLNQFKNQHFFVF